MSENTRSAVPAITLTVALVLILCGIAGGSNFILIKSLVGTISPVQLVAARVLVAGLTLGAVLLAWRRRPGLDRATLKDASVLALIDAVVPYMLIAIAAPHILAPTAAVLIATMPVFTSVVVSFADRTRIAASTAAGVALGAFGVSIIAGPVALDLGKSALLAILAVLLASLSYALSAVYSRIPLKRVNPVELSAVKFAIAGVVLAPVVAFSDTGGYGRLDLTGWVSLFMIGFMVTGLARCGYVWVIDTAGSVTASLLTYVVPVAALGIAWIFLGEVLSFEEWVGALLVGASTTCVLFGPAFAGAFTKRWRSLSSQSAMAASRQPPT